MTWKNTEKEFLKNGQKPSGPKSAFWGPNMSAYDASLKKWSFG